MIRCQFITDFHKDQQLHHDVEIIYVLNGHLILEYEGNPFVLEKEDFILINSDKIHRYTFAAPETVAGGLFIDYRKLTQIMNKKRMLFSCYSSQLAPVKRNEMRYYIRQIFNYYAPEGEAALIKNSIAYRLLYILCTEFVMHPTVQSHPQRLNVSDEREEKITNYISTHYSEKITLSDLAKQLYLSETYLSKYIGQVFGMSFVKLLNNIRLEYAISDLSMSDKPVAVIAIDNGFSSLSWFNKIFREKYGISPGEYRDRLKPQKSVSSDEAVWKDLSRYLFQNESEEHLYGNTAVVKTSTRNSKPLVKNWNELINIGDAAELLRYDVRDQLLRLKDELHFQYVRIWNLFSPKMMVEIEIDEQTAKYSFREIDKVLDFLIHNGLYPYIELGSRGKWYTGKVEEKIRQDSGRQILYFEKNREFLKELINHWADRYGEENVARWYIELERVDVAPKEYFHIFHLIWNCFKTRVPDIKIGGLGFCIDFLGDEFVQILQEWKKEEIHPDMLTLYCYPYITNQDPSNAVQYSSDADFMKNQIANFFEKLNIINFPVKEVHVSEWGYTLSNRNILNDSAFKGAYIMKNCLDNIGDVKYISYCSSLDLVYEYYDTTKILFGGNGLITKDGIYKPAYHALYFLQRAKEYLLGKNSNAIVTYDGKRSFHICCHNYKHFNYRYYQQSEEAVSADEQEQLFMDYENLFLRFEIEDIPNGTYIIRKQLVNQQQGCIQAQWKKLSYYENLGSDDLEYLRMSTHPTIQLQKEVVKNQYLVVETTLEAQEIQEIMITYLDT